MNPARQGPFCESAPADLRLWTWVRRDCGEKGISMIKNHIPVKISSVHKEDIAALASISVDACGDKSWTPEGFDHFIFAPGPTNAVAAWYKRLDGTAEI